MKVLPNLVFLMIVMHQVSAGVIFTRWGRTTCPHSSITLHVGYVGKSHWNHSGSGSNYLCLHSHPKWGSGNIPGFQDTAARIYGVEYQLYYGYSNYRPFSYNNVGGRDLHDNDALCVVCYNPEAHAQYMVPSRPDCPNAMHLEYSGYLVSERYMHQSSGEYVCLDIEPEARVGGEENLDGGLFYPVEAACGSLPCPPYVNGNELTCAVCTI